LICLYDDNRISIEGSTDLAFTEDRLGRFKAYGWQVQQVQDGDDLEAIARALKKARKATDRPSLIAVRTCIGCGSPNKQDKASAHGEPLGEEEVRLTKQNLNWPPEPAFFVPDEVAAYFRQALRKGKSREKKWAKLLKTYEKEFPDLGLQWGQWISGDLPRGWDEALPVFPPDPKGMATRVASGTTLNALASRLTNLIGGSADLEPSNKTFIKGSKNFGMDGFEHRNLRFGVREHGMGSIMNGLALHGGVIPYGGTFLIFSDYMRPPIRLAAMMGLKVIYIFTHDSIGLGEDGPTHQPVEQLAGLRSVPNLLVIRPADANETVEAWRVALAHKTGPVALILTRQNLPTMDRTYLAPAAELAKGGYVLYKSDAENPALILISTGSEIPLALEAAGRLKEQALSSWVVNLPSWKLFEQQSEEYRNQVLPPEVTARVAVEAGSIQGWRHYVGDKGTVIGLDHFGASAPYKTLYEKFGLTVDQIVNKALALLKR
jgi:transketolase